MTDLLNDPALNPPGRPDFRRVGKGVPLVLDPETGKMVRRRRSSSAGKVLDDESNLVDWQLRTVLVGAAQMPEVLAMVSTLDPDADKKQIRDYVEECIQAGKGNQRKVKGTAVHAMFDHVDLGDDWEPAPQFKAVVDAYREMLAVYGLVPEDVEVACVNDAAGTAGTMDRRYRTTRQLIAPDGQIVPIGSRLVGDTKTGLSLEYAAGTYATQLASYVDSVRYDVLTDERTPFDPPNFPDWALVVHAVAEQATCELLWVDVQQGRQGLALAAQVWEWRRNTGLLTPAIPPLRAVPAPPTEPQEPSEPSQGSRVTRVVPALPDGSVDVAGLKAAIADVEAEAELLPQVKEWLRGRVKAIVAHSDVAAFQLQRQWPVGVPGLKAEGHTWDQLDAIEAAVDRVETDHSVPFGATDPRHIASRQNHPSADWSDKWSKPSGVPPTSEELQAISNAIADHPRSQLLREWSAAALAGSIGKPAVDRYPLAHALLEFGRLPVDEWSDDDVTTMLIGTLNAMGYSEGLADLGVVEPHHAPIIMTAAFAIASGNAMLMFDADDKPVVRFNVIQQKGN